MLALLDIAMVLAQSEDPGRSADVDKGPGIAIILGVIALVILLFALAAALVLRLQKRKRESSL